MLPIYLTGKKEAEMCKVPSCYNYSGRNSGLCRYHKIKFDIRNIIEEEENKHRQVAKPIHNSGKVKLKYI